VERRVHPANRSIVVDGAPSCRRNYLDGRSEADMEMAEQHREAMTWKLEMTGKAVAGTVENTNCVSGVGQPG